MNKKLTNKDIINETKCCIAGNCKSCPLRALISSSKTHFEWK